VELLLFTGIKQMTAISLPHECLHRDRRKGGLMS